MKRINVTVSILAVLLCAVLGYAWYTGGAITPRSGEDYKFESWHRALEELKEAGFRNITLVPVDDGEMDEDPWMQAVREVSIDAETDFGSGKRYGRDVPVQITYCRVPHRKIPLNSEDVQSYDHETIVQMFRDAGFTNLFIREYRDLDPAEGVPFLNEVLLEEDPIFAEGQEYPHSLPIVIGVHFPANAYRVCVEVAFGNAAGPVRLLVDDVAACLLEDGQTASHQLLMEEGVHTLTLQGPDGEVLGMKNAVNVDGDMTVCFSLTAAEGTVLVNYQEKR